VLEELVAKFTSSGSFAIGIPLGTLILCGLGLPLPEDIVLFASGFAGAQAGISVFSIASVMYFGIIIGDCGTYSIGRFFGRSALNSRFGHYVFPPHRQAKAQEMFHKYGNWVIFVGRFLPGLRAPIFFTAGSMHFSLVKFILLDGFAALISAPLFVWAGHWAATRYASNSEELQSILGQSKMAILGAAIIGGLGLFLYLKLKNRSRNA
jgi:membrane protein DedA with SNARE-associated domain